MKGSRCTPDARQMHKMRAVQLPWLGVVAQPHGTTELHGSCRASALQPIYLQGSPKKNTLHIGSKR